MWCGRGGVWFYIAPSLQPWPHRGRRDSALPISIYKLLHLTQLGLHLHSWVSHPSWGMGTVRSPSCEVGSAGGRGHSGCDWRSHQAEWRQGESGSLTKWRWTTLLSEETGEEINRKKQNKNKIKGNIYPPPMPRRELLLRLFIVRYNLGVLVTFSG